MKKNIRMYTNKDRLKDRQIDRLTDGPMDGCMDGWMDGWIDEWMDSNSNSLFKHGNFFKFKYIIFTYKNLVYKKP